MKRVILSTIVFSVFLPVLGYGQVTVKGRVLFNGTPPAVETIDVKSDMATCGRSQPVQKLVLGADQGIAHAVVRIIGAAGTVTPASGILDQKICTFVPHVQVLPLNSTLKITSSDPVLHNSHGFYEDGSTAFNIAVPIIGMEVPVQLKKPGVIKLRCDAGHIWMSAYVVVVDQPYYALTDGDGNFTIENVPAGSYEIETWHEWLGKHRELVNVTETTAPVTITLTAPVG